MRSRVLGFAVLGALSFMAVGCGETASYRLNSNTEGDKPVYVRLPSAMVTKDFVKATGFNRDHAKNNEFAIGWLPSSSIREMNLKDKTEITRLDELAVTEGRLNPFTMETMELNHRLPIERKAEA